MKIITKLGTLLLIAAMPISARANQERTQKIPEQRWAGTVTAVNTQNKTLTCKRWEFTKTFNIGENCAISTVDNKKAALGDLSPGEKVLVHYQNAEGVLVADRIAEKALRYDGTVHRVDPQARTVTMDEAPLYQPFVAPKTFRLASDGRVILRDGQAGKLTDLRAGDHLSVIYNVPGNSPVAYRVRDHSSAVVGTVAAIDLPARMVKAKGKFGEEEFSLADKCEIILSGRKAGHLKDLTPGQEYRFTYEDVNGINVLSRIAPPASAKLTESASIR